MFVKIRTNEYEKPQVEPVAPNRQLGYKIVELPVELVGLYCAAYEALWESKDDPLMTGNSRYLTRKGALSSLEILERDCAFEVILD